MNTRFLTQIRKINFVSESGKAAYCFQIYCCEVTEAGNPLSGWKEWRNNGKVVRFNNRQAAEAVRARLRFLIAQGRIRMQKVSLEEPSPVVAKLENL